MPRASVTDAFASLDASGAVRTWSPGAAALLGWRADDVVGRSLAQVLGERARRRFGGALEEVVAAGGGLQASVAARHRRGHDVDVEVVVWAAPADGAHAMFFAPGAARHANANGAGHDLRLELESARLALAAARRECAEAEARSHRFLADAAHQLRTPVAGIRSCAEALLGGVSEDRRDPLLAAMVRESARAGRLVADLLRVARLEDGTTLSAEPCDLVALCADECDRLHSRRPTLDVVLGVSELFERLPVIDAAAVGEIVANLLDNAARHAAGRVEVVVEPRHESVEVRVTDDGPGLEPGHAELVFERFVSLDGKGGSGLGLSIARALARAHGGDLTYEGGAFVVRLPAAPADPAVPAGPAGPVVEPAVAGHRRGATSPTGRKDRRSPNTTRRETGGEASKPS